MNKGMLWFDNDPKTDLAKKIEKAVAYYQAKYGYKPNAARVNPSALAAEAEIGGVSVHPYRPVLPGHIWIGMEEA